MRPEASEAQNVMQHPVDPLTPGHAMERQATQDLVRWANDPYRKPLILQGVRQVGKTWLMKDFARRYFPSKQHYFSFEAQPRLREVFSDDLSPDQILRQLSLRARETIQPGALVLFEDAHHCPNAIRALKYFHELRPDLRVIAAGALLGLPDAQPASFPVGKVSFMTLEPLSFTEFLRAQGEDGLVRCVETWSTLEPLPELLLSPLTQKLHEYVLVGGMPEPARVWCENADIEGAFRALKAILERFQGDVRAHAGRIDAAKITRVWASLPKQLSRENTRFRYGDVEPRSNARKYGGALAWLTDAQMVRIVRRVSMPCLPLKAYCDESAFKVFVVDAGLLASLSALTIEDIADGLQGRREAKVAFAENLVLQSLVRQFDASPCCWAASGPRRAEVDFLISHRGYVIPIEVAPGANARTPGLRAYKARFERQTPLRVRLSMRNLSLDGDILTIPLPMLDATRRLIDIALDRLMGNPRQASSPDGEGHAVFRRAYGIPYSRLPTGPNVN